MNVFNNLEKQALCPHTSRSKEVICGQKTGDTICNACGEIFMAGENITPIEFRDSMIVSGHALMIAMRVNSKLKLTQNFQNKSGHSFDWALVDASSEFFLPVHSEVATIAISGGYVNL